MTSLFKQLEAVVSPLPGWATVEKAQTLAAIVIAIRPEITIELGVFGGRSLFGFAMAHKHISKGVVWAVDPWSNAAAMEGYSNKNAEYWRDLNLDAIYTEFMRNVNVMGLKSVIKVLRAKSDDVVPPPKIDVAHIDGSHTQQAVRDVHRFAPNVRTGGLVIMDDLDWQNDNDRPVQRAAEELKKFGFVHLYPLGTGAVFQRV